MTPGHVYRMLILAGRKLVSLGLHSHGRRPCLVVAPLRQSPRLFELARPHTTDGHHSGSFPTSHGELVQSCHEHQ